MPPGSSALVPASLIRVTALPRSRRRSMGEDSARAHRAPSGPPAAPVLRHRHAPITPLPVPPSSLPPPPRTPHPPRAHTRRPAARTGTPPPAPADPSPRAPPTRTPAPAPVFLRPLLRLARTDVVRLVVHHHDARSVRALLDEHQVDPALRVPRAPGGRGSAAVNAASRSTRAEARARSSTALPSAFRATCSISSARSAMPNSFAVVRACSARSRVLAQVDVLQQGVHRRPELRRPPPPHLLVRRPRRLRLFLHRTRRAREQRRCSPPPPAPRAPQPTRRARLHHPRRVRRRRRFERSPQHGHLRLARRQRCRIDRIGTVVRSRTAATRSAISAARSPSPSPPPSRRTARQPILRARRRHVQQPLLLRLAMLVPPRRPLRRIPASESRPSPRPASYARSARRRRLQRSRSSCQHARCRGSPARPPGTPAPSPRARS